MCEVSTESHRASCGARYHPPRQPGSLRVASRSREERAALEVRAALRLQTRSAQACSQNAQAPPRSDFSKKCLSSRSPELPGRVLPNLSEPLPLQVLPGDPVLLLPPLRTSPELRPSPRPFRGAGPNRTGPSWAARARPLTMASLFKKKTVDGEFRVGLVRPAVWRCSGQGSRAVPGGGPGSAPQVTMAASLRLPGLTWPVCLPDCAHPTHLFLFFFFPSSQGF